MERKWSFGDYEDFAARAASDLGIRLVNSIDEAGGRWGLRKLSRSEFEELEEQSRTNRELEECWVNRLEAGYDRDKSQLAIGIEEIFSDVPCANQFDGRENAA